MADPVETGTHTPQPWRVRYGVCRNDHPDTSADVQGRDGQFVADCGCHDQANANAEFITRACNVHADLLAAVKLAESVYRLNVVVPGEPSSVLDALQQAIRKAEGPLGER